MDTIKLALSRQLGVSTASLERAIATHGTGLCEATLRRKLTTFEGNDIAGFCEHLAQRNVAYVPSASQMKADLDGLDRQPTRPA